MKSDMPLDYAVFQLSPRNTRCELFVSSDGSMEKIASGSIQPFAAHLKVVREQVALAVNSIKLEVERHKHVESWFTKGTLERFVRFVSTPDVLELVNTFDAEISQLEAARKIYSQGAGSQISGMSDGKGASSAAEATKKELLKAIDVRLAAVSQDLTMTFDQASAAGFDPDTIPELKLFAEYFGAQSLNEACIKYLSVHQRRPNLLSNQTHLRSSCESDMSIDNNDPRQQHQSGPSQAQNKQHGTTSHNQCNAATCQQPMTFPPQHNSTSTDYANNADHATNNNKQPQPHPEPEPSSSSLQSRPLVRRLSVQERISLFESKQKENTSAGGGKPVNVGKPAELRRLSSDADTTSTTSSSVLRRWSGTSDMSVDSGGADDQKDSKKFNKGLSDTATSVRVGSVGVGGESKSNCQVDLDIEKGEDVVSKGSVNVKDQAGSRSQVGSVGTENKVGGEDKNGVIEDQLGCGVQFGELPDRSRPAKLNNQNSDGGRDKELGQLGSRTSQGHPRSFSGQLDELSVDETHSKVSGGDQVKSRSKWKSNSSEVVVCQKELIPSVQQPSKLVEDSGVHKIKLQKPLALGPEPVQKTRIRREESGLMCNNKSANPDIMVSDNPENYDMVSPTPVEQVQRVRQSKGNQELNDELKMKATELEKLFAEHKSRVPSDQASSSRRNKPANVQEQEVDLQCRKSDVAQIPQNQYENDEMFTPPGNMLKFSTDSKIPKESKMDYSETLRKAFPKIGFSDDSRGKYYEKYMQKRNVKLSDEWTTNGAEKKARLKAMQDSLEKSRAEMKAKLSGFVDKQGSVSGSRSGRRSSNTPLFRGTEQSEEDEPLCQSGAFSGESTLRSAQIKKALAKKTRAAPIPRSSVASNSNPGKRRMQTENPIAQSVPNFTDFRKENTKHSAGASRAMDRTQVRNHARTRSYTEDEALVNEEKPKKSQSSRKSYVGPLKDISDSSYDDDVLEPLKTSISDERFNDDDDLGDTTFEEENEELESIQKVYHCTRSNGKSTQSTNSDELNYSEYEIGDSLRSKVDPTSIHELAPPVAVESLCNSPGESPIPWKSRMHEHFPYPQETSDIDASADSPGGSPAYWNSHLLSQTEDDIARIGKKWVAAHRTVHVCNSSQSHSRKDVTKGFKRLLKFGRKNRGSENLADWVSVTTSEGDDDTEDGRDPASRSSEEFRKSRMGISQGQYSDDGFNESELFTDQVQALQSSIPAPPANFKLREDHVSGSSIKAPRSFFSLSTFRSKGSDPKAR